MRQLKAVTAVIIAITATLWVASCAQANLTDTDTAQFRIWLAGFVQDAQKAGISDETIYATLNNVQLVPKVIEQDRNQPSSATKTFDQYMASVVPKSRTQDAKKKYQENKKLLNEIGKAYGVQPRFIVALWGLESNFGTNTGKHSVINALATLAYDGRRADFFRGELMNALKIVDQGHLTPDQLKGSWAGAMGQTQFMPSSFLQLAVDYDGDGRQDIWNSKADVFASIANYLSKTGWDKDTTWGREVQLPENFDTALIGRSIEKTLGEWNALGVRKTDGKALPGKKGLVASLIQPEEGKNKTYLVYSNYKTVLKWNRSLYFATSVGILSDSIQD